MSNLSPFFRLYRRTSGRTGKEYLVGRLGMAKVVAFEGRADDGTPTWEIYLDHEGANDRPRPDNGRAPAQRQPARRPEPPAQAHRRTPPPVDEDGFDWERGDPIPELVK